MQTLDSSDQSATRGIDSPVSIFAGQGTPDIHRYWKLPPARWLAFVSAVMLMHIALIALLWVASLFESTRLDQDLAITLSDAGGQASMMIMMEAAPDLPTGAPVSEVQPESIVQPLPPTLLQSEPAPVQEQASTLMPAQATVKQPILETSSTETPKSQVSPPVVKEKPVQKPVEVAQPTKKQATTEPLNIQKSVADKSTREDASGSMQAKEPASSEGSNTSVQVAPKLVKSPKPRYPSESIRLRQEGRVVVNIEVLDSGSVGQATIAQSSGFSSLDQSALDAVKNWQYANGSGSGELVRQWVRVSIVFELKNR